MSDASKRVNEMARKLFPGASPGCGDGNCVFGHPGGMHTNGGCRCLMDDPFQMRRKGMMLARIALALAEEGQTDRGV